MTGATVAPSGRIPCVVLGCRRTAPAAKYPPGTRIICAKCWRLVPKWRRRRLNRLGRIIDRKMLTWGETDPGSYGRRLLALHGRAWERAVAAATEAKVGIG